MTAANSCWYVDLATSKADEELVLWESESVKCFEACTACFACHVDSTYHRGLLIFNCDFFQVQIIVTCTPAGNSKV